MKGKCALYNIDTELKSSHIIPKFAFNFMKQTGGKYLRTLENPNLRLQDGIKEYLLGEKAEQEFGKRERWFANNIFFPYMKGEKLNFEYDENLSYFLISVLWRTLVYQLKDKSVQKEENFHFLDEVAEEWRLFLSEYKYPIKYNDINIFLTDRVASQTTQHLNADLYLSRVIDATIIHNQSFTTIAIYAKFLRFIVWSVVKGNPNDCKDIKVNFSKGEVKLPQKLRDDFFGGFIMHRIEMIDNRPKPSQEQQIKIINELEKNEFDFWNSDAGKAMINDMKNASH